jgi:hypothetical protein
VTAEPTPTRTDIYLPWSYWDGVVETELRVDDYPYGGGLAGSGVQLTLGRRSDGQIMAVRLPRESAHRLARAILDGPEPEDAACLAAPGYDCPDHPGPLDDARDHVCRLRPVAARLASETETTR